MEMLGSVKAHDEHGEPHVFDVYRSPKGYSVRLDGAQFALVGSHLDAIQAICDIATAQGYHGRKYT